MHKRVIYTLIAALVLWPQVAKASSQTICDHRGKFLLDQTTSKTYVCDGAGNWVENQLLQNGGDKPAATKGQTRFNDQTQTAEIFDGQNWRTLAMLK